jgi:mRNA interferase HigB
LTRIAFCNIFTLTLHDTGCCEMRIISRKALKAYWDLHPESEEVLTDWHDKIRKIRPKSFAELRKTFPSADVVGDCVVFNVGGNNYRIIIHLDYRIQVAWIRFVLSHSDYDKERWKADC